MDAKTATSTPSSCSLSSPYDPLPKELTEPIRYAPRATVVESRVGEPAEEEENANILITRLQYAMIFLPVQITETEAEISRQKRRISACQCRLDAKSFAALPEVTRNLLVNTADEMERRLPRLHDDLGKMRVRLKKCNKKLVNLGVSGCVDV
eukprot:8979_1